MRTDLVEMLTTAGAAFSTARTTGVRRSSVFSLVGGAEARAAAAATARTARAVPVRSSFLEFMSRNPRNSCPVRQAKTT